MRHVSPQMRWTNRSMVWVSIAAGVGLAASVGLPAQAAVGLCDRIISSGPQTAASETEAKRAAIAVWRVLAERVGPQFGRWQIAWCRRLTCERADSGGVRCEAVGGPCRVEQVGPKHTNVHARLDPEAHVEACRAAEAGAPYPLRAVRERDEGAFR